MGKQMVNKQNPLDKTRNSYSIENHSKKRRWTIESLQEFGRAVDGTYFLLSFNFLHLLYKEDRYKYTMTLFGVAHI